MTYPEPPLGMDDAARVLGMSRTTLRQVIKRHPHYECRGKTRKVFYTEHIAALRKALKIIDPMTGVVADGKRRNIPWDVMSAVLDRDKRTCVYCGDRTSKIELDHVIPVARGGNNTAQNLVVACHSCNRQKGRKTLPEFLHWRAERGLPIIAMGRL